MKKLRQCKVTNGIFFSITYWTRWFVEAECKNRIFTNQTRQHWRIHCRQFRNNPRPRFAREITSGPYNGRPPV